MSQAKSAERVVGDIRRKTRRRFSAEEKIRIVLEGLRGEESIAALCRREGLNPNLYYRWSKEFLEAGKKRLLGDTTREATSTEVADVRKEVAELKHRLRIVLRDAVAVGIPDPEEELRLGVTLLCTHPQRIDLRRLRLHRRTDGERGQNGDGNEPSGMRHAGVSAQEDGMSNPDPTAGW